MLGLFCQAIYISNYNFYFEIKYFEKLIRSWHSSSYTSTFKMWNFKRCQQIITTQCQVLVWWKTCKNLRNYLTFLAKFIEKKMKFEFWICLIYLKLLNVWVAALLFFFFAKLQQFLFWKVSYYEIPLQKKRKKTNNLIRRYLWKSGDRIFELFHIENNHFIV